VRPLLEITREQVEEYLRAVGQSWREDASNRDVSFARNRIRHELLPLLRRDYNPGIDQVLAETAEIARAEEEYWEEALREIPPCRARSTSFRGRDEGGPPNADLRGRDEGGPPALQLELMLQQPVAVRRRMVRAAAARLGCSLDFHHVEQVLALIHAAGERRGAQNVQVPGLEVTLSGRELRFAAQRLNKEEVSSAEGQAANSEAAGYDYPLALPGEVFIREIGRAFRASYLERRPENAGYNGYQLEPATLGSELRIRNWRAGDRYWPAHTKSPRKVKELLQERHILQPEKSRWPVVEAGNEIVWVPGFAPAAKFLARTGTGPVVVIEEVPVGVKGPSA